MLAYNDTNTMYVPTYLLELLITLEPVNLCGMSYAMTDRLQGTLGIYRAAPGKKSTRSAVSLAVFTRASMSFAFPTRRNDKSVFWHSSNGLF